MKKTLSLLLVFVLCVSLCACGASANPEDNLIRETKVFAKAYIEAKLPNMLVGIKSIDVLRHEKIPLEGLYYFCIKVSLMGFYALIRKLMQVLSVTKEY